jgi:hypothetical protein
MPETACALVGLAARLRRGLQHRSGPSESLLLPRDPWPAGAELEMVRRLFARAATRAGIRAPWVTPHALRHTHATRMWEGGMRDLTLQRRLGHASVEPTRVYNQGVGPPGRRRLPEGPRSEGGVVMTVAVRSSRRPAHQPDRGCSDRARRRPSGHCAALQVLLYWPETRWTPVPSVDGRTFCRH